MLLGRLLTVTRLISRLCLRRLLTIARLMIRLALWRLLVAAGFVIVSSCHDDPYQLGLRRMLRTVVNLSGHKPNSVFTCCGENAWGEQPKRPLPKGGQYRRQPPYDLWAFPEMFQR